jgi:ABC-2 type transport system permease protein
VSAGSFDIAALGRPITGPQALTGDWRRFWHLSFNIAKSNWKLRFFGSVLGVVWQLVRPLLLFAVLYIFFTKIAKIGTGKFTGPGQQDHFYGAQLLGAIVLFTYFSEATMGAVRCVVDSEVLVRKIEFPRMVIPVSVVLLSTFNVALNLIVVFGFALIEGVRPMLTWLELPLILGVLAMLSLGLAMLLSTAFVYFRDIQPIWEVVLQVMFYSCGVMIPIYEVGQKLGYGSTLLHVYMANPITATLQQFKHAVVIHASDGASVYLGGSAWLAIPGGIVLGIFLLGFWVFNRAAPYVAENL